MSYIDWRQPRGPGRPTAHIRPRYAIWQSVAATAMYFALLVAAAALIGWQVVPLDQKEWHVPVL